MEIGNHLRHLRVYFLLISISLFNCCYSQKEADIWYFGNHAGLDFNSGSPVVLSNSMIDQLDCSASIADATGRLKFYTDGRTVWNRSHSAMPNGTGLLSNTSAGTSVLIVPHPGNENLYYVFTVDNFAGPNGLCFSIVDMRLDNGLGDVTTKNVLIFTPSSEKMTAVVNQQGNAYWLITHPYDSDAFNCYIIDNNGFNPNPVISHSGQVHTGGTYGTYNACGQMKVSPDGKKLALAILDLGVFELFDFNNLTGSISNPMTIHNYSGAWGLEFSPDSKKLYTTQWTTSDVMQFDLSVFNLTAILNSAMLIGNATVPGSQYQEGYMQLAPDKKIYIAKYGSDYLSIINNPDNPGISCNFSDNGINLNPGSSWAGLTNFVQSFFNHPTDTIQTVYIDTSICTGDSVFIAGRWLQREGSYVDTVMISAHIDSIIYTTLHVLLPPEISLGNDAIYCSGQNIILTAGNPNNHYLWQDGTENNQFIVRNSGIYYVNVCNICGCASDTVQIELKNCNCNAWIANAFSPNRDTYNDTYFPVFENETNFSDYQFLIFNRWGSLVFKSDNIKTGWDGKYNGAECPQGVYFYILSYSCLSGEHKTTQGSVTLVR